MKRMLLGLLTAGSVAGVAIFATNAFFSDVETSTGNTFQAGKVDLKISSQCTYNGQRSDQCGTWDSDDLGNIQSPKFFNFTDVKPGDWGENTIDFSIQNNPAWMCANLNATTKEKLADYLHVLWWIDDGDNVYENNGEDPDEKILYGGPRTLTEWLNLGTGSVLPLTFADSYLNWRTWPTTPGNTLAIPALDPQYLGVAWCFGSMTVTGTGTPGFTCNGAGDHNDAQGTKVVADLIFTAEQARNNPGFLCPEHQPAQ